MTLRAALNGDSDDLATELASTRVDDDGKTPSDSDDGATPLACAPRDLCNVPEGKEARDVEDSDVTDEDRTQGQDGSRALKNGEYVPATEDSATVRKMASTSEMARDRHDRHELIEAVPRRRASSMSSYTRQQGRLRFHHPISAKAAPAECAITACSVRRAESPKLNTVYQHPAARYRQDEHDKQSTKTAQTVVTPGSSTLQMVWEEPPVSTSDDDVTLFEEPGVQEASELAESRVETLISTPDSPMLHVKTKLTAWSWEREQGDAGNAQWQYLPLLNVDNGHDRRQAAVSSPITEYPPGPPNTTASSSNRGSHPSSARASAPQTPHYDPDADNGNVEEDDGANQSPTEEDDQNEEREDLVELRVKDALSRFRSATVPTSGADYMSIPFFAAAAHQSRRLSNLAEEDEHFKTHRDSVDVYHKHLRDEGHVSQPLQNTRDSFFITKSKFESKYPSKTAGEPSGSFSRFGGLSPILDSSPPDSWRGESAKAMAGGGRGSAGPGSEVGEEEHPLEHVGCAVCAVEWEKWFEARRREAGEDEEQGEGEA